MKTIAFYLPQFHVIPENNAWWGEGFTEWVNVKKAVPLFPSHRQPRVPFEQNYYDLSDGKTWEWQIRLASEYRIYGFCIYHYWFGGKLLLEKPLEHLRDHKELQMPFCICWANENWTKAWVSEKNNVLIEQNYGDEAEWIRHYRYLSTFFNDSRYMKEDGKPVIVIYKPELISCIGEMMECWKKLAQEDGFPGLVFMYQSVAYDLAPDEKRDLFDYDIEYQPTYARTFMPSHYPEFLRKIYRAYVRISDRMKVRSIEPKGVRRYDYDKTWQFILKTPPVCEKSVPCAFVDWDNTPRRGNRGSLYDGASPEKFKGYFKKLIQKAKNEYKKEYVFIFAWNEWAEGGYLEPDEENGYRYLEAVRDSLSAEIG